MGTLYNGQRNEHYLIVREDVYALRWTTQTLDGSQMGNYTQCVLARADSIGEALAIYGMLTVDVLRQYNIIVDL